MKNKNSLPLFLLITTLALGVVLAVLLIFSIVKIDSGFYDSLSVASLCISFFSFSASMFFSLAVYLQSKNQNKINDSLPKKDDQYIIANYSLFNIERELSFFKIHGNEKDYLLKNGNIFTDKATDEIEDVTRIVFLPTDSMNIPTYKVYAKSISFVGSDESKLYSVNPNKNVDGDYSANILQRGYNCITVDLAENNTDVADVISRTHHIELQLDIVSVFNVKMSVKFFIYLDSEKDCTDNPDKKLIPTLQTYTIHHSNYVIEEKSIVK